MIRLALAFSLLMTAPAGAVTLTETSGPLGSPLNVGTEAFTVTGDRCGTGRSVKGDGCGVARKSLADGNDFGRRDLDGDGFWIDSNDNDRLKIKITGIRGGTFSFGAVDMNDRPPRESLPGGGSRPPAEQGFRIRSRGEVSDFYWIVEQTNGAVNWMLASGLGKQATILVSLDPNDGAGFDGFSTPTAPVPLPAGLWLMLAAGGALGALRARRRAA